METVTLQVLSHVFKNHLTVFGESCGPPGEEQRTGLLHKPLLLQAGSSNPEMRQLSQQSSALKSLRHPLLLLSPGLQMKFLVIEGKLIHSEAQDKSEQSGCGSGCSLVTAIDSFGSSLQALLCLNGNKIDLLQINFLNCIINP